MENLESIPDQKIRLLMAALVNEQPPDIPYWVWRALRRIARRIEENPTAIFDYLNPADAKGLVQKEDFGRSERIEVEKLWEWSGQPWGGLPDGTSIVDHMEADSTGANSVG